MSLILLIELLSVKACQKRESCCKLDAHEDNKWETYFLAILKLFCSKSYFQDGEDLSLYHPSAPSPPPAGILLTSELGGAIVRVIAWPVAPMEVSSEF